MSERWINGALAVAPELALVPGRCAFSHEARVTEHSRGYDYEYATLRNELRGVVCDECGAWFLDPRPAESDFPTIYPERYAAYEMSDDAGRSTGLAFRAKSILERAKIRRYERHVRELEGHILDVGCGDGMLLDGFVRAGFPKEELVGLDFHPAALALTRHKGYRVIEGTVEEAHLEREQYRLVVMNQLIEHVVDPIGALRRLRDALVPGGVAFLETPNLASPNARWMPRRYWGGYHYPRHLHLFTPKTMEAALERAGLEFLQVRYVPCPVQWVITANSFLKERRHPPAALLRLTDWRNPLMLALFTALDLVMLPFGTANMQVAARRP